MITHRISKLMSGLGFTIALGIVISACGTSSSSPTTSTTNVAQSKAAIRQENLHNGPTRITVANQHSAGLVVVVKTATIPEVSAGSSSKSTIEGYVALASSLANKPSEVLGYTKLTEVNVNNIKIHADANLTTGTYFVLLDPSGASPTKVGGQIASAKFTLTVP